MNAKRKTVRGSEVRVGDRLVRGHGPSAPTRGTVTTVLDMTLSGDGEAWMATLEGRSRRLRIGRFEQVVVELPATA